MKIRDTDPVFKHFRNIGFRVDFKSLEHLFLYRTGCFPGIGRVGKFHITLVGPFAPVVQIVVADLYQCSVHYTAVFGKIPVDGSYTVVRIIVFVCQRLADRTLIGENPFCNGFRNDDAHRSGEFRRGSFDELEREHPQHIGVQYT